MASTTEKKPTDAPSETNAAPAMLANGKRERESQDDARETKRVIVGGMRRIQPPALRIDSMQCKPGDNKMMIYFSGDKIKEYVVRIPGAHVRATSVEKGAGEKKWTDPLVMNVLDTKDANGNLTGVSRPLMDTVEKLRVELLASLGYREDEEIVSYEFNTRIRFPNMVPREFSDLFAVLMLQGAQAAKVSVVQDFSLSKPSQKALSEGEDAIQREEYRYTKVRIVDENGAKLSKLRIDDVPVQPKDAPPGTFRLLGSDKRAVPMVLVRMDVLPLAVKIYSSSTAGAGGCIVFRVKKIVLKPVKSGN